MNLIYHIADTTSWAAAGRAYRPQSLDTEGFIHCSDARQVLRVANQWFSGRTDLVLLAIDRDRLRVELRYENTEGGDELFPHVYGPLDRDIVVAAEALLPDAADSFFAPPCLQADLEGDAL
jgi:uncharacterized protein (DUF952 family)